jgi:hypothetical protein
MREKGKKKSCRRRASKSDTISSFKNKKEMGSGMCKKRRRLTISTNTGKVHKTNKPDDAFFWVSSFIEE